MGKALPGRIGRRDRERYDLVDDRRDLATRTPRAVRGGLVACLQYGHRREHQRPVGHLRIYRWGWGFSTSQEPDDPCAGFPSSVALRAIDLMPDEVHLEARTSRPGPAKPGASPALTPASRGERWRHCHHHVVRRNRERIPPGRRSSGPGDRDASSCTWTASRVPPSQRRRRTPAPCSASTAGAGASQRHRTSTATSP